MIKIGDKVVIGELPLFDSHYNFRAWCDMSMLKGRVVTIFSINNGFLFFHASYDELTQQWDVDNGSDVGNFNIRRMHCKLYKPKVSLKEIYAEY